MFDLPGMITRSDDADFLRELIQDTAQRLMAVIREVDIQGISNCAVDDPVHATGPYREHRADYASGTAACRAMAPKLGCSHETLRASSVQAACDAGEGTGPTTEGKARIKALKRENRELRTANAIPKRASAHFARAEFDRPCRKRSPSSTRIARCSRPEENSYNRSCAALP